MKKLRLFNVTKPRRFKTPSAPAHLEEFASKRMLEDGIKCPICHHVYGDANGFHAPCDHLAAHYGPFGWELAPHEVVKCLTGASAFRVIETLAIQGNNVVKVASDDAADLDWVVWKKASQPATMVA